MEPTTQTQPLNTNTHTHTQQLITHTPTHTYITNWDGTNLILLQPHQYNPENNTITYQILGHHPINLPYPLDHETLQRQSEILWTNHQHQNP